MTIKIKVFFHIVCNLGSHESRVENPKSNDRLHIVF